MRTCFLLMFQFFTFPVYAALGETAKTNPAASDVAIPDPVGIADFFQVFLGLAVVVIAIVAMAWIIKRVGYVNTRTNGQLKVVGGLTLTQRERLLLVQVGKKQLLIGVSPGRISTLHELEENIDTSSDVKPSMESFSNKLQSLLRKDTNSDEKS